VLLLGAMLFTEMGSGVDRRRPVGVCNGVLAVLIVRAVVARLARAGCVRPGRSGAVFDAVMRGDV